MIEVQRQLNNFVIAYLLINNDNFRNHKNIRFSGQIVSFGEEHLVYTLFNFLKSHEKSTVF